MRRRRLAGHAATPSRRGRQGKPRQRLRRGVASRPPRAATRGSSPSPRVRARPRREDQVMAEVGLEPLVEQQAQAPRIDQRPRQRQPPEHDAQPLDRRAVQRFGVVEVGDVALRRLAAEAREPFAPAPAGRAEQGEFAERLQRRAPEPLDQRGARGRREPVVEQVHRVQPRPVPGPVAQPGIDLGVALEIDDGDRRLQVDLQSADARRGSAAAAAPASSSRTRASASASARRRGACRTDAARVRSHRGDRRRDRTGAGRRRSASRRAGCARTGAARAGLPARGSGG